MIIVEYTFNAQLHFASDPQLENNKNPILKVLNHIENSAGSAAIQTIRVCLSDEK